MTVVVCIYACGKKAIAEFEKQYLYAAENFFGEPEYSINKEKAEKLGFVFSDLQDWIYDLVDYCIGEVNEELNK